MHHPLEELLQLVGVVAEVKPPVVQRVGALPRGLFRLFLFFIALGLQARVLALGL